MYRYMLKSRLRFSLFVLLLIISCGSGSLFALVMSALVDSAGKDMEELLKFLLLGVFYVVMQVMISIIYNMTENRILTDARYSLKSDLFVGIMNQSVAYFDAENSAGYLNELNNNVNLFESLYFCNIIYSLKCLFSMAAAAAICIFIQPLMLVLMIFLAFITMGVTRITSGLLEKATRIYTEKMKEYTEEIKDDFGGFRLVHSFGILPFILNKHSKRNKAVEEAKRKSSNMRP